MVDNNYWRQRLYDIEDLHDYLKFIPEFFSQCGEASSVKYMYEKLHDEVNAYKHIETIDLSISRSLFNQYEMGFIKHLNKYQTDKNIIGITNIANDKFIDAIFNGSCNKPVDMELKDAVGNLEVLIDLIPDIESMISNSNRIGDKTCYDSYIAFVNKYIKSMIENILDTYHDINIAISEVKGSPKKTEYKLFI